MPNFKFWFKINNRLQKSEILDLSTFLVVLSGKKKLDFIFLTNDLFLVIFIFHENELISNYLGFRFDSFPWKIRYQSGINLILNCSEGIPFWCLVVRAIQSYMYKENLTVTFFTITVLQCMAEFIWRSFMCWNHVFLVVGFHGYYIWCHFCPLPASRIPQTWC